jgi:protein-disulfide isomerase
MLPKQEQTKKSRGMHGFVLAAMLIFGLCARAIPAQAQIVRSAPLRAGQVVHIDAEPAFDIAIQDVFGAVARVDIDGTSRVIRSGGFSLPVLIGPYQWYVSTVAEDNGAAMHVIGIDQADCANARYQASAEQFTLCPRKRIQFESGIAFVRGYQSRSAHVYLQDNSGMVQKIILLPNEPQTYSLGNEQYEFIYLGIGGQGHGRFQVRKDGDAPSAALEFPTLGSGNDVHVTYTTAPGCTSCAQTHQLLTRYATTYADRLEVQYIPTVSSSQTDEQQLVSRALQCVSNHANPQIFWSFHGLVLQNPTQWSDGWLTDRAISIGVNRYVFDDCMHARADETDEQLKNIQPTRIVELQTDEFPAVRIIGNGTDLTLRGAFTAVQLEQKLKEALGLTDESTVDQDVEVLPQAHPTLESDDHVRGDRDARFVLITYSDLVCPFCASFEQRVTQLQDERDDLAWVYRHFPLPIHAQARPAAIAAECVARHEGEEAFFRFVEHVHLIQSISTLSAETLLDGIALVSSDDSAAQCFEQEELADAVEYDYLVGVSLGVRGTPISFLIDQETGEVQTIYGAISTEQLRAYLD